MGHFWRLAIQLIDFQCDVFVAAAVTFAYTREFTKIVNLCVWSVWILFTSARSL